MPGNTGSSAGGRFAMVAGSTLKGSDADRGANDIGCVSTEGVDGSLSRFPTAPTTTAGALSPMSVAARTRGAVVGSELIGADRGRLEAESRGAGGHRIAGVEAGAGAGVR